MGIGFLNDCSHRTDILESMSWMFHGNELFLEHLIKYPFLYCSLNSVFCTSPIVSEPFIFKNIYVHTCKNIFRKSFKWNLFNSSLTFSISDSNTRQSCKKKSSYVCRYFCDPRTFMLLTLHYYYWKLLSTFVCSTLYGNRFYHRSLEILGKNVCL